MFYYVKDYMEKDVAVIDAGASAEEASKTMSSKSVDAIVVIENGQPKGIVTEWDLVQKVMAKDVNPLNVKISEVMSTPLITVDPDTDIEDAVKIMTEHGIRRLPVVRDNIIYGMFSEWDLTQHFNEYEDKLTRDIIRSMALSNAMLAG